MVRIRSSEDPILDIPKGSIRHGRGQVPCGGAPPPPPRPPVSLEQLLATQNDLMMGLVEKMSVVRPSARNPDIKRRILRTWIFW
jgi:hypothetical protein